MTDYKWPEKCQLTREQAEEADRLIKAGWKIDSTALKFRIKRNTLKSILQRLRHPDKREKYNQQARELRAMNAGGRPRIMSTEQLLDCRDALADGVSYTDLSIKYGVPEHTIRYGIARYRNELEMERASTSSSKWCPKMANAWLQRPIITQVSL